MSRIQKPERGVRSALLLGAILHLVLPSVARADEDPFAETAGETCLPTNIRISAQFIEVPHPVLTTLLSGPDKRGHAIHRNAMDLVAKGQAKVIETTMVTCKSSQRAAVESLCEVISPTEWDPPVFPGAVDPALNAEIAARRPKIVPETPSFWDTRNTGTTFEVEPCIWDNGLIDVRFVPEIVSLVRMDTITPWITPWGDASIRRPVFSMLRSNTSLTLLNGVPELAGILNTKPAAGPVVPHKVLLFIRADILTAASE
ncbi:MAG: hypothetical protein J0M04_20940 [Verrucomicrobia bacterium]|nr:hypothetical protein [Verrucomicrobiota bacterium]